MSEMSGKIAAGIFVTAVETIWKISKWLLGKIESYFRPFLGYVFSKVPYFFGNIVKKISELIGGNGAFAAYFWFILIIVAIVYLSLYFTGTIGSSNTRSTVEVSSEEDIMISYSPEIIEKYKPFTNWEILKRNIGFLPDYRSGIVSKKIDSRCDQATAWKYNDSCIRAPQSEIVWMSEGTTFVIPRKTIQEGSRVISAPDYYNTYEKTNPDNTPLQDFMTLSPKDDQDDIVDTSSPNIDDTSLRKIKRAYINLF